MATNSDGFMLFTIVVNQKAVVDAGFIGLKLNELVVFDVVRMAIAANWTKKITEEEKTYAWVSEEKILEQLPILDLSKRQVHRLVDKLVDAGLLARHPNNMGKHRVYVGLGPKADLLNYGSMTKTASSEDQACHLRQAQHDKNGKLSMTLLSGDNNIENNTIKDNIPPTPSDGVSVETPVAGKRKKIEKSKNRITYAQACEFYDSQIISLPEEMPGVPMDRQRPLREGYRILVQWMKDGDLEIPNGMRDSVMLMGEPLAFKQMVSLAEGPHRLTFYQIKHYLTRMHNYTEGKNKSVYLTICNWHNEDMKHNRVPASKPMGQTNGVYGNPKGLSQPTRVEQP